MNHWTDEELILEYYGEGDGDRNHFDSCPDCQERMRQLERTLEAAAGMKVPARGADYGRQVWVRIEPKLEPRRRATVIAWPKWAVAGALAASLVIAFSVGRYTHPAPAVAELPPATRQRLLDAALTDHLDRSQRVLLEVVNSPVGEAALDRTTLEDIIAANRLYRVSAQRQGDLRAVAVLEDLERLLLEAANSRPDEAALVMRRAADTELLFRVRTVRDRVKTSLPSGTF